MTGDKREVLLEVKNLRVEFKVKGKKEPFVAVRDVSFSYFPRRDLPGR